MDSFQRKANRGFKKVLNTLLLLSGLTVLVLSFQNCSEFVADESLIIGQANFESQTNLDVSTTEKLNQKTIAYWKKPSNSGYVLPSAGGVVSDSVSFAALVSAGASGTLLSIRGGAANVEDCSVAIQSNQVRLYHLTDAANYASLSAAVPSGDFVVAGRCGTRVEDLELQINGVSVTSTPAKVGTSLADFAYILRTLVSVAAVKEVVVFEDTLSDFELNVLSRKLAIDFGVRATADYSLSLDVPGAVVVDPNFAPMLQVYNNKCASCHTAYSTASQFVAAGWVAKGDPANSKMFWRLKDSGVTSKDGKPQNMPMSSTLTTSEIATIRTWIQNMQ